MHHIHAYALLDHHKAQITSFSAEAHDTRTLAAGGAQSHQHNADVRIVHAFFAKICEGLKGFEQVLIFGSKTALSDFRHYVEKHYPGLMPVIIGYESYNGQTEGQLLARAEAAFHRYERTH